MDGNLLRGQPECAERALAGEECPFLAGVTLKHAVVTVPDAETLADLDQRLLEIREKLGV
jgi:hypothetical protein